MFISLLFRTQGSLTVHNSKQCFTGSSLGTSSFHLNILYKFGCIGREEVENGKMHGSCGFERKKKMINFYTRLLLYPRKSIKKSFEYFVKLFLILPNELFFYNLQKIKKKIIFLALFFLSFSFLSFHFYFQTHA